jgi:hypothetical protein
LSNKSWVYKQVLDETLLELGAKEKTEVLEVLGCIQNPCRRADELIQPPDAKIEHRCKAYPQYIRHQQHGRRFL